MGHIIWLVLASVIFIGFVVVVAYLAVLAIAGFASLVRGRGDR